MKPAHTLARALLVSIALLALPRTAPAGDTDPAPAEAASWLEVTISVPRGDAGGWPEVELGEPLPVRIEARHPRGAIALLPETLELPAALAERRAARRHERSGSDNLEVDTYHLELIALEAGDHEIPAIPLALGATTAKTNPVAIRVRSNLGEDEQKIASSTLAAAMAELEKLAAPNPAPREIEVTDYTLAWVALGVAALIAAFFVARAIRRRMRAASAAPEAPAPPPRPAHEVALERLEALRRAGHLERNDIKGFYVELSEILRAYAGGRYGFESLELTVAELIGALRGVKTPGLDVAELSRILDEADLVKFAKYLPPAESAERALKSSFAIVEATTPAPSLEEVPGAPAPAAPPPDRRSEDQRRQP